MHKHVPRKFNLYKDRFMPVWLNHVHIHKLIKTKNKKFKLYLKTKRQYHFKAYQTARNKTKSQIRKSRIDHETKLANSTKTNPKKFWKYVNKSAKSVSGISALKKDDQTLATTDLDKAHILNQYFSSVFTNEDITNVPKYDFSVLSNGLTCNEPNITPDAVHKKLSSLQIEKAYGPDGIPPIILFELRNFLATPLSHLFSSSLQSGEVPCDWRRAHVTAIFKKGNRSDPGNYRPVSLTCIVCKLLESFVRDSIDEHMESNKLYSDSQHGFRRGRSCQTQLLETITDIAKMKDSNESFDIIYLDFRKAFDSVPYERIISKLNACRINPTLTRSIKSFLSHRSQIVIVNSQASNISAVTKGIPQGSILGPTLFNLFINDINLDLKSPNKIFADDTKLYNTSANSDLLQSDLYTLHKWSTKWQLHFNISKCKCIHFGQSNPQNNYKLNPDSSQTIPKCDDEKDLGVTFDKTLTFDKHKFMCFKS